MTPPDIPMESLLHELNEAGPGEVVPALLGELNRTVGATSVRLLFADVEERVLNVWGRAGDQLPLLRSKEQIEGSIHGRVYLTGRSERGELGGRPMVVAPVVAKSEHIGVLEVFLRGPIDDHRSRSTTPAPRSRARSIATSRVYVSPGGRTLAACRWTRASETS